MGAIESGLAWEPLTAADAEGALPLSAEAGWNQTAADWAFMLREGRGIGVRDGAGRWIGSALALPLGAEALLDQHGAGREGCASARHRHAPAAPRDRRGA